MSVQERSACRQLFVLQSCSSERDGRPRPVGSQTFLVERRPRPRPWTEIFFNRLAKIALATNARVL